MRHPYVNPASVWLFPVLGLIAPATYLAAVLLTLYWVVRWRPRAVPGDAPHYGVRTLRRVAFL